MEGAAIILLIFLLCFYFLPSGIAVMREHHNTLAIFLLNLFLGWSLVGWVAALVWAATVVQRREETRFVPEQQPQMVRTGKYI